jgi:hypothetical protein
MSAEPSPIVVAPPSHLLAVLDRLDPSPGVRVRVDFRPGAIQLSTHDGGDVWETAAIAVAEESGDARGRSVTVPLDELRRAVAFAPSQGLTGVELEVHDDVLAVDGDRVRAVDELPAAPEARDAVPVELELPADGPAVVLVDDTERLALGEPLVERLRARVPHESRAFERGGDWYVSVTTGSGDVERDPVVIGAVSSMAIGTE